MSHTMTYQPSAAHLERLGMPRPTQAKADLNKVAIAWRVRLGQAVGRCFRLANLSAKEAAALLDRSPAQISKWMSGDERPQLDVIFACDALREPLVIALAEMGGHAVEVTTHITVRRVA